MSRRRKKTAARTRNPPASSPPAAARSGARGEQLAAEFLARAGYRLVARNLRTTHAEIDLLVRKRRTFVAVEVKARALHAAPERTVNGHRLDRLQRALLALLPRLRPRPTMLRIDVIAVRWLPSGPELSHFTAVRSFVPLRRSYRELWRRPEAAGYVWPTPLPDRADCPKPMPTLAEQIIPRRKLMLMASEAVIFTAMLFFGTSLPPLANADFPLLRFDTNWLRGLLTSLTIAIICQASLSYNDLYDWKVSQNRAELPNRLLHSCGYALVMLACLVLALPSLFFFPGLPNVSTETWKLILLLLVSFMVVWLFRHAFHWFFYKWRFGERVLVLGTETSAQELGRMIVDNPLAGFELVGLVHEHETDALSNGNQPQYKVVGNIKQLRELCEREAIARVVVSLPERRGKVPVDQLLECRMSGVQVEEREAMYERLTGKIAVESMRPSYLIFNKGFAKDPTTLALKRVLDILAAFLGIVLSLPISIVAALAIVLTSRGPLLFAQERIGQDGEVFRLLKFRTMHVDAEKHSGPVWAVPNDARVTLVGRLLRLTRCDEIPQFYNILAGQMSFVGPRPERPHFVEQLRQSIPFYPLRHTVKPGLTGWAQVRHPYGATTEDAQEKLRYDLYYIKNMSLLFDLNIILRTTGVILLGKGAR